MNFTFNFFYPVVTTFASLWAAAFVNPENHLSPVDVTTGCRILVKTTNVPHLAANGRSRRTRTRASHPTTTCGPSVLRRSARLQQKYAVPQKPILSPAPRRRRALRREGAVANLRQYEPTTTTVPPATTTTATRQLKREDSFILVDYGHHFRMVKPAYAMRYFHSVPERIRTIAPYHAFGVSVEEQELRARLLAVPIDPTIGTKRVRFVDDEEPDVEDDDARPRKRRRLS